MRIFYESTALVQGYKSKGAARGGIFQTSLQLLRHIYSAAGENDEISLFSGKYLDCSKIIEAEKLIGLKTADLCSRQAAITAFQEKEDAYRKQKKGLQRIYASMAKHFLANFSRKLTYTADIAFYLSRPLGFSQVNAKKNYLMLYDMIPMLLPQYKNTSWMEDILNFIKNHANDRSWRYFAISQNTKKDFLKHIPSLPEESITVIPLAADGKFYIENNISKISGTKAKYGIPADKKYILSLCSIVPHKNILMACKAFCAFIKKHGIKDLVFVLAGGANDKFKAVLQHEFTGMEGSGSIIFTGYTEDCDMAALYSGAEWFVYTSQYEGFGLPPLEAMQCGTPVITSNNSSLPEVVGDAGIMVDYDSLEQHIKAYGDYYFNEDLRKQNAAKGIERAKQFSWEKAADIILQEFRNS